MVVGAAPGPFRMLLTQLPPLTRSSQRAREKITSAPSVSLLESIRPFMPPPIVCTLSSLVADQFRQGSSLLLLLRSCSVVYVSQLLPSSPTAPGWPLVFAAVLLLAV